MKKFLRWLIKQVFDLIANLEVEGYENLPRKGGFVIAVNHFGFLDTPLAYYFLGGDYDIFIVVGEKWEENPLWRWLGKHLNLVFINRFNLDLNAMRDIRRRMDTGETLVIAPEGTRAKDEKVAQAKPGVAYLASKMDWDVFPIAIYGTGDKNIVANLKKFKRSKIKIRAGKIFKLPPFPKENRDEVLQEYTDEIMCRIAVMLPEENRGYYADHPRLKELMNGGGEG